MPGDPKPGDLTEIEKRGLKRLFASALAHDRSAMPRPAEASIRAYLEGRATAAQKREVRGAMPMSQAFADEILHEMQARTDLQDPELASRLDKIEVPLEELMVRARRVLPSRDNHFRKVIQHVVDVLRGFWRPTWGYGLAAAVFLGTILLPRSSSDTIRLLEYRPTRGDDPGFVVVTIARSADFVDLVVEGSDTSKFDPAFNSAFRVTLQREGEREPLLVVAKNRRTYPAGDGFVRPALRIDTSVLTPGRYTVEFLPLSNGSAPSPDSAVIGRFEIRLP